MSNLLSVDINKLVQAPLPEKLYNVLLVSPCFEIYLLYPQRSRSIIRFLVLRRFFDVEQKNSPRRSCGKPEQRKYQKRFFAGVVLENVVLCFFV